MKGRGAMNTSHFNRSNHSKVPTFEEFGSVWNLKWIFKNWKDTQEGIACKYDNDIDYLTIENLITEMCIYLNKSNDIDVKGGKHTNASTYKQTVNACAKHRPICKCGYPAEVFLSKTNEIWFKCAIANATFVEFNHDSFSVAEPCNFLQKYSDDIHLRHKFDKLEQQEASDDVKRLPKLHYKVGYEGSWAQELPCSV